LYKSSSFIDIVALGHMRDGSGSPLLS